VRCRAPIDKIEAFRRRFSRTFTWVSPHGNDFNYGYRASFRPAELATGTVYYNYAALRT
jgi:predicted dithiol-disulfide oxidoreductase (DUF899 family)